MSDTGAWGFTDDRGVALTAARTPERVVAYVRAGAALLDLGVTPVAVYGSGHDGDVIDPVKAGGLEAAGVLYLGPGRSLDEQVLRELRPDLVVDVTYDGKSPYALDEAVADRLGVPSAALCVGNELMLPTIIGRFGALAAALRPTSTVASPGPGSGLTSGPGPGTGSATDSLASAEEALRVAAGRTDVAVLALSGAGSDQVHLARPHAWPELARLLELGARLLEPGQGPGANWLTADWEHAARLAPDLVLFDSRANAMAPDAFPPVGHARVAPWNPEIPPSPAAYARFFHAVAEALDA
ncbi:ABC transporter substrate-binding protein [Streptomyces sp. ISL-36]|uniref:ABC transporter substrate-binding protein n=1 Tax=Streptomyces sp. ISL-36 TaxID=2819182 RepID=UPI001BE8ABFC|nr:ABC transporter substrate-binding protein [Streptomyces sp. ISL-36]MBT2441685.1 ABC transporter substrate-binding protein [Streptomyces sp. ISL-36]